MKHANPEQIMCAGGSAGAITCHESVLCATMETELEMYKPSVSIGLSGALRNPIDPYQPKQWGVMNMHGDIDPVVLWKNGNQMMETIDWAKDEGIIPKTFKGKSIMEAGLEHVPFDEMEYPRWNSGEILNFMCEAFALNAVGTE